MNKKIIKITESDLEKLVQRVIMEEKQSINEVSVDKIVSKIKSRGGKVEPHEEEKLMTYVKNKVDSGKDYDVNITQKGFSVTKGDERKKIFGFDQIGNMVKYINEGGEDRSSRYMFFSNLEQIHRQTSMLLDMDEYMLENILENGHDWAQDHIAEAKNNMDQVFDFIMNEVKGSDHEYHNNVMVGEAKKKGLWDNIRAKRKRGEKPAKPGDEDYPDKKTWEKLTSETNDLSESLKYHLDNRIPLTENVFRFASEGYLNLLKETRSLYFKGKLRLSEEDEEFILTDIGTKGIYEGKEVWLDVPFEYGDLMSEAEYKGREVQLNHPMRNSGKGKKYMVYVKDPSTGNVRKITFGDKKGGLTAKLSDPEARKSFAARHNCSEKKDKTTSGYWACRLTKFGHLFNGKTYPGYW
jgi:hypothetical protein